MNPPVTFVTVINSFNRLALLEKALGSLTQALRNASFGSAIMVFEAGSTDGSREFLEKWCRENPSDRVMIVEPDGKRTSFSDGVNAGCAAGIAAYPDCRWLFLYETDNWLAGSNQVIQAIHLLETHPKLAAAGFTVRRHSGLLCGYGTRFPSVWSLAAGQNLCLKWHLDAPNDTVWQESDGIRWRTCDVIFTSPLVIRREVWEQTKGLDAVDFPFSDCDLDWAWRCAKQGWEMAVIECEGVVHDNLQLASDWSANRMIDFHRNRLRLLQKYRPLSAIFLKPLLFLRHAAETLLLALRTGGDPLTRRKLDQRTQLLRTVWSNYRG